MIQIERSKCIGCGLCARDCFPGAITCMGTKAELTSPENCIGCGHCIAVCPCGAVTDPELPMEEAVPFRMDVSSDDLLVLMRSRRSCRQFTAENVSDQEIGRIIDAARACPTAKNLQNTRYIVVRENVPVLLDMALTALSKVGEAQKETAKDPAEIRRANNFISWASIREDNKNFDPLFFHAPVLLMFVSKGDTARDTAAGAAYAELMVASMGLGCLYSGYFTACAAASEEIRELLGLSDGEEVVRCLVIGRPAVKYQRTAPRKTAEIKYL